MINIAGRKVPAILLRTGPGGVRTVKDEFFTAMVLVKREFKRMALKRTGLLTCLKFNGQCSMPFGMKMMVDLVIWWYSISSPIQKSISASKLVKRSGSSARGR